MDPSEEDDFHTLPFDDRSRGMILVRQVDTAENM
jgi:hypothetical protein